MVSSIRNAPAATLRRLAHLQRLLEPGNIQPVYQPIVRTTDLEPIGYEGLSRFPYADGLNSMPPDVTLAAAAEIGMREDLEVACWSAIAAAGSPPDGRLLFVNISPGALRHPGLFMLADQLPSRLVIEITEQTDISDYAALRAQLAPWIARGAQIAIDDTGAGYASLEHVVELRPDFLKLTRGLVADIDKDANRQALLRALGAFAREVGAVIVAEGVERREELEVLRDSQIDFAQGWLFGRPGRPWPEVPVVEHRPTGPSLSNSAVQRMSSLEAAIALAETPAAACEVIADHLAHLGVMPSVYLEQGERLRCLAARGYYALYDGMTPDAGLVGRCYRTGEVVAEDDVATAEGFLRSTAAVNTARCLPVKLGTRVVGVLCVESAAPIGDEHVREADKAVELLVRRLAEFGPLDAPTAGQRLARAAARTAHMEDADAVVREAAAAALEVSGMESVLIALRDADGHVHAQHAAGPLADTFTTLSPADLMAMGRWVDPGTSMLSMADATGRGDGVAETLRQAGAGALLTVPLAVGRARVGFLALADRSTLAPDTERTELVELLGVQCAAQLRGLAAVGELRDRAARDPLTGLEHEAAFHKRLPRRRQAASEAGQRTALVLAELGEVPPGTTDSDTILRDLARLLAELAPEPGSAYRLDSEEFALLLDTPDRGAAQEVAWTLQAQARERLGVTLSIGVAVADTDESDQELLERADGAVSEVRRRGRDGVALAVSRYAD
jgi:EAL domain-containing protein (putative c-di-GMP-specific phosphodiesterase class I)/GGDEF domain-containing protein/putative methionine-R-sulfoxide reductase with GAF domain